MKIFLLTHERELRRVTNTGAIALEFAGNMVERIVWQRVNPPAKLTRLIDNNQAILLYSNAQSSAAMSSVESRTEPSAQSLSEPKITEVTPLNTYNNIIIIDSTWQEAQKIYNQSPYLKQATQFTLKTGNRSSYKLRANQAAGGLCTIECIIEVLKLKGQHAMAAKLAQKFTDFNR